MGNSILIIPAARSLFEEFNIDNINVNVNAHIDVNDATNHDIIVS